MTLDMYEAVKEYLGEPLDFQTVSANNVVALWQPIYDRTQEDTVYGNHRGCLDSKCLCRVEANLEYVAFIMLGVGYNPIFSFWQQVYNRQQYLRYSTYERIRQNYVKVALFVNFAELLPRHIAARTSINFEDINILEHLVFEALDEIRRLVLCYFVSNEIMCGES